LALSARFDSDLLKNKFIGTLPQEEDSLSAMSAKVALFFAGPLTQNRVIEH
jgi:hypothetical protein